MMSAYFAGKSVCANDCRQITARGKKNNFFIGKSCLAVFIEIYVQEIKIYIKGKSSFD